MARRWPDHECDDDGSCMHCGADLAEEAHLRRLGYDVSRSTCSVQDQAVRDRNFARYIADRDQHPADSLDWGD